LTSPNVTISGLILRPSFRILLFAATTAAIVGFGLSWIAYFYERQLSVLAAASIAFASLARQWRFA
jgi:hypothetical protein